MSGEGTKEAKDNSCQEKTELVRAYSFAVADYSRAIGVLESNIGILRKAEYIEVRSAAEQYRQQAEAARRALDDHVAEHGC